MDNIEAYIHISSYHPTLERKVANENNPGIGLKFNNNIEIGRYLNSDGNVSYYIMKSKDLVKSRYVEFGVYYGAVTGYKGGSVLAMLGVYTEVGPLRALFIPDVQHPAIGFSIRWN